MTAIARRPSARERGLRASVLADPLGSLRHPQGAPMAPTRPRPRLFAALGAVVAAAALASVATCALARHLLINLTRSMPLGLYWMCLDPGDLREGDLVAFRPPLAVRALVRDRGYLPDGAFLLKPIAAVGSDDVCIEGNELRIRGQLRAHLRSKDSEGRPLPRDARCGPLAPSQLYVLAPDPRSFDSRIFGPVSDDALHATVTPLWTF
jgi:conjugative transfer signal peptidase TraF